MVMVQRKEMHLNNRVVLLATTTITTIEEKAPGTGAMDKVMQAQEERVVQEEAVDNSSEEAVVEVTVSRTEIRTRVVVLEREVIRTVRAGDQTTEVLQIVEIEEAEAATVEVVVEASLQAMVPPLLEDKAKAQRKLLHLLQALQLHQALLLLLHLLPAHEIRTT
jgi:hypothetical protein